MASSTCHRCCPTAVPWVTGMIMADKGRLHSAGAVGGNSGRLFVCDHQNSRNPITKPSSRAAPAGHQLAGLVDAIALDDDAAGQVRTPLLYIRNCVTG